MLLCTLLGNATISADTYHKVLLLCLSACIPSQIFRRLPRPAFSLHWRLPFISGCAAESVAATGQQQRSQVRLAHACQLATAARHITCSNQQCPHLQFLPPYGQQVYSAQTPEPLTITSGISIQLAKVLRRDRCQPCITPGLRLSFCVLCPVRASKHRENLIQRWR